MNKIKTFFRTLALSAVSPRYYADVLIAKFSFSLKYFLGFQLLSALVVTALIIIPVSQFDLNGSLTTARSWYPQDLVVTFDQGHLSINKPLPYVIAFPNVSASSRSARADQVKNFIVFDSDKQINGVTDVMADKALIVLTETTAYVDENQGNLRTYSLSQVKGHFVLGPQQVDNFFTQIKTHPFIAQKLYVPALAAVLLGIMLPFMMLFSLIGAAVYGFFVWIMSRLLSGPLLAGQLLSYKKAVQVTFHSLTLVTLLQTGLMIIGQEHYLQGFWYLGALLLWTAVVLKQSHRSLVVQPAPIVPDSIETKKA